MQLLLPYKWQVLGLSGLVSLAAALATIGPQFIRYAFDVVIPSAEVRLFLFLALGFALFHLVQAGFAYASMYLSYAFTQSIISGIRMRAYSRLLRLPVSRFIRERSGSLVSRVVADVNALEGMIQSGATRLMGQFFSILVVAVILVSMNWQLALVNLMVLPLLAGITRYYQGPLRQMARSIRARVGVLSAVATEAIGNIQVVKAFAAEGLETRRFQEENDHYVGLNLERRKDVGRMESLISITADYGMAAIMLLGGWLIVGGGLSVGELTAFLLYQRMLQGPVMSLMMFNNQLQAGLAALERVSDLLNDCEEQEGSITKIDRYDLIFQDVTFTFPEAEKPALKALSFALPEGQNAALVGPSGAGKSTITKLLSRFYDPDKGAILLGAQNLKDYTLSSLRQAIAVVPQEPTLFSGSVLDNIRYAKPDASYEEIRLAARLANAENFILELPEGFETEIGERGIKLSGGQKQRIAIARAILKDAKLLILDEATSALDSESEAVIQDALSGLFASRKGVSSLVIAHRLSTIHHAQQILVLDEGRVLESGTHAELMRRRGLYQHLYDLQFRETGVNT